MKIRPQELTIQDYLHQSFDCDCQRSHQTALQEVIIESGAICRLPELLRKLGYHSPMVICDRRTLAAAGNQVFRVLREADNNCLLHVIGGDEVVPDETALGGMLVSHRPDVDVVLAVGTGTINDLCKFMSHHLGLPYIAVATAPSMDGFASIGAALITDSLKTTYDTHVPVAIVGDVEVLRNAPMNMILAGIADILGKYTCLADWRLAQMITGEYYCPVIVEMVKLSKERVIANAERVLQRDSEAVKAVMEALVLTGIAMSFVGNSRPASGSEHHISHYWEMRFLFENRKPVLHGTKVGIGTVISCYLYHQLAALTPDYDRARQQATDFDHAAWEQTMHRTFLQAADGVIALEKQTQKNGAKGHATRIAAIEKRWPEIVEMALQVVPTTEQIINLLGGLGAHVYPAQEGIDSQMVYDSVVVAKEVRDRYTILQLLWDLGIADDMAKSVADWVRDK